MVGNTILHLFPVYSRSVMLFSYFDIMGLQQGPVTPREFSELLQGRVAKSLCDFYVKHFNPA